MKKPSNQEKLNQMGHDIIIANCPNPPTRSCVEGCECTHYREKESYMSFNFSKYDYYWHISNAHGHQGAVVEIQLTKAIAKLANEGVKPCILSEEDGWTPEKNVFMYHLTRLRKIAVDYPDSTWLSDQCWSRRPDPNDPEPDNDHEPDNEPDTSDVGMRGEYVNDEVKLPASQCVYFRHPIKGNMLIDDFASASEVFTYMTLRDDARAPQWLELAKSMHDVPQTDN